MTSSLAVAAYLALFFVVGLGFVFVNLLIGSLFRAHNPQPEKLEVYECGEPTIGTSYVQFDLRFYVVALIFLVFDVEVAFLFPIAAVWGKADHLRDDRLAVVQQAPGEPARLTAEAEALYRELGVASPALPAVSATLRDDYRRSRGVDPSPRAGADEAEFTARAGANEYMYFVFAAAGLFFTVLMVGFAYEWKIGSLDWVRTASDEKKTARPASDEIDAFEETASLPV